MSAQYSFYKKKKQVSFFYQDYTCIEQIRLMGFDLTEKEMHLAVCTLCTNSAGNTWLIL